MIKRRRLMRDIGKACSVASWMIAGAGLLTFYLAHTNPLFDHPLRDLRSNLSLVFSLFLTLGAWLNPGRASGARQGRNSAWIGVGVIVATGLAGVAYVAWHASTGDDYIVAAAILLLTIVMAAVAGRFVAKHGTEIGEARFMTTERQ